MARLYTFFMAAASAFALASVSVSAAPKTGQSVIVTLKAKTDVALVATLSKQYASVGHRRLQVVETLDELAKTTQAPITTLLANSTGEYTNTNSFWLTNQVYIENASEQLIAKLKALPEVDEVTGDEEMAMTPSAVTAAPTTAPVPTTSEWNLQKINVPQVWASGYTGQNVIVGHIDTGVLATHVAIKNNFRSNYGWFDPETKNAVPYDSANHGTHTLGVIAGSNGIGVAPGVQWIACKGCRSTGCFVSDLLSCLQFMTCPTDTAGNNRDCSKAPHLVSNSWSGGQGVTVFNSAINSMRAAGIIPIFAAGNSGPSCGTLNSPGDLAMVITVGATDINDALYTKASKGPTVTGLRKPDLSAPGVSIRSSCSTSTTYYCKMSGTSMATPHVAGTVALLLSAKPSATYDEIKAYLDSGLVTSTLAPVGEVCGGIADNTFPNNHFGAGRLDAYQSLLMALKV